MYKLYKNMDGLSIKIETISAETADSTEGSKIISIFVQFILDLPQKIETVCLDKQKIHVTLNSI